MVGPKNKNHTSLDERSPAARLRASHTFLQNSPPPPFLTATLPQPQIPSASFPFLFFFFSFFSFLFLRPRLASPAVPAKSPFHRMHFHTCVR
eukprot:m.103231 g.103231  ORF g.103231 m.103231 type:complete len:92 (-) comp14142_c1_seq5:1777-2052(-)